MLCISDLQLRPFRTDDFITKLFYETSRFSSFQHQWVLKARVDHDQKDPTQSSKRTLSYQLVLKSRTSSPLKVLFMALKGPYGDLKVTPSVYEFEFSNDSTESDYHQLPTVDVLECNKLLASKTINVRLVLFQVQQQHILEKTDQKIAGLYFSSGKEINKTKQKNNKGPVPVKFLLFFFFFFVNRFCEYFFFSGN